MIGALARKIFGSSNERRIRSYVPRVNAINALEKELEKLSDEELRARTAAFKKEVAEGKSLDDCRESLQDALQEMIAAYRQQRKEIPVGGGLIEQLPVEV